MAGIRINSNNFNGESVEITFNPFSGGTIDLGTQTIPYDYVSSNYEGNYSIFIPSANKTCPLQVGVAPTPTPSPTQTNTPTPTLTPTLTSTPTPTPSSSAPAGDPDANAYLADVVASGGTTNPTIEAAVQTLFTDLKSAGLYSKMLAMWPFVGSTASSHSINALLNKSYDITWFGGMTHGVSGSTGNGSNGYGRLGITTQDTLQDDYSFGYYQFTNDLTSNGNQAINIGANQFGSTRRPGLQISSTNNNTNYFFRSGDDTSSSLNNSGNGDGFYVGNRTGSTTSELYRNGSSLTSISGSYTEGGTALEMYLFNFNTNTGPFGSGYVAEGMNFSFVGEGLNTTELSNLSTIINTFQTTLGRNTY